MYEAIEGAAYIEDTYQPLPQLSINAGLRYSLFRIRNKTYLNPEPRLSVAYRLPHDWALKASYATMNQYVHLLSNSGVGLPTDLWVPATDSIPPQRSRQVALGIAKDLPGRNLAITAEGFYKQMDRIIAYREGASFLILNTGPDAQALNEVSWEENVTVGRGWAYGAELLVQRKAGRLSGWIGYTLSWIRHQFDEINRGRPFYARHDRRHDLSIVGIYQLKPSITLSATWVYGTGNAITVPTHEFQLSDHSLMDFGSSTAFVSDFGPRNSFRAAPYHRLDVGVQFHKKKRWGGAYLGNKRVQRLQPGQSVLLRSIRQTRGGRGAEQPVLRRAFSHPAIIQLRF